MPVGLLNLRIWVTQRRQIARSRLGIQIREQSIVALLGFQLRNFAVRIVDIAKDDRLGRAHGLASGNDLAVAHFSSLELRLNLRPLNALHAVSAFLHDAAAAHRHIRIAH